MTISKELKKIKRLYGEKFMHLCRRLFPTILEQEGVLIKILQNSFATNSRTLGEDITEEIEEIFKNYIYDKLDVEEEIIEKNETKTPKELLAEVGYDLYECTTEKEIQSFKKYYKPSEQLCTFYGGRLNRCIVFWAVKKNVEEIKRENFKNPKREDEYGTSVMSIQFSIGSKSIVSIKNRYNHTVNNPDATYGNDLNKIVPGLSQSFAKLLAQRNIILDDSNIENLEIQNYTVANDGKYYKYNMEINGIYYCPGNIIIDHGNVIRLQPEKQILIDYFILDKKSKTLKLYDETLKEDSFIDGFKNIRRIQVEKDNARENGARKITIQSEDSDTQITIEINRESNIIGYINESVTRIGNNFLGYNIALDRLELPNLIEVGDNFLKKNEGLKKLSLPNLRRVGNNFIKYNHNIKELSLINLRKAGDYFLGCNRKLTYIELNNLEKVGNKFIYYNRKISKIKLPNLKEIGSNFLMWNRELQTLELPNVRKIEHDFLFNNQKLEQLKLPRLTKIGNTFLAFNRKLKTINLPSVVEIGNDFLFNNQELIQLELPKLELIKSGFINRNEQLKKIILPNLRETGDYFISNNEKIEQMELPNLTKVGDYFLKMNSKLKKLSLPSLKETGDYFISFNNVLSEVFLPNLIQVGDCFLNGLENSKIMDLSKLRKFGIDFLYSYENKEKILRKVMENIKRKYVHSEEIAKLDKDSNLTSSEIDKSQNVLFENREHFQTTDKNIDF